MYDTVHPLLDKKPSVTQEEEVTPLTHTRSHILTHKHNTLFLLLFLRHLKRSKESQTLLFSIKHHSSLLHPSFFFILIFSTRVITSSSPCIVLNLCEQHQCFILTLCLSLILSCFVIQNMSFLTYLILYQHCGGMVMLSYICRPGARTFKAVSLFCC